MTNTFRKLLVSLVTVTFLTGCVRFECDPKTGIVKYSRTGGSAKAQEVEFEFSNNVWKVKLSGYEQQNPEVSKALAIAEDNIKAIRKLVE